MRVNAAPRTALVTGATGFVGGRLAQALADDGWRVRGLVRDRSRAKDLADRGVELFEGDVQDADSLRGAGEGAGVAYYLVHSMGRGGDGDFEEMERRAATNFAEMAKREGVGRVVYLGGLGDQPGSKHLRSRQRTAEILRESGPPLTYFRAGMVVGAGSESYRTLRYLVQRLPAMIAPAWLSTPTQPIAVDDVIAYLRRRRRSPSQRDERSRSAALTSSRTATCSTGWLRRSASTDAPGSRCRCSPRGCHRSGSGWSLLSTPGSPGP